MALFKPAWRVFGARFAAAVRSFRPGKHFFDGVGARFGPFFTPSTGKTILRWRHSLRRYRFTVDI